MSDVGNKIADNTVKQIINVENYKKIYDELKKFNFHIVMIPGLCVLFSGTLMYLLGITLFDAVSIPFIRVILLTIIVYVSTIIVLRLKYSSTSSIDEVTKTFKFSDEEIKKTYTYSAINVVGFLLFYIGIPFIFGGPLLKIASSIGPTKVLIPGIISFFGLWGTTQLTLYLYENNSVPFLN